MAPAAKRRALTALKHVLQALRSEWPCLSLPLSALRGGVVPALPAPARAEKRAERHLFVHGASAWLLGMAECQAGVFGCTQGAVVVPGFLMMRLLCLPAD